MAQMPIAVGVMNGYSSSSTATRTSEVVKKMLTVRGRPFTLWTARSHFAWSAARRMVRWVESERRSNPDAPLVLVGKSLGAVHIIERVLPQVALTGDDAAPVYLLTIDPNYPTWKDWAPNLNQVTLRIPCRVARATNVYVLSHQTGRQCGARVEGDPRDLVENIPVSDRLGYDHYSIVKSGIVSGALWDLLEDVERL